MSQDTEEEEQIMEERIKEADPKLELALSINEPIENIMYKEPVLVTKDTKVAEAVNLFNDKNVGCVLVIDDKTKKLIGIFTERDVIRKLVNKGYDIYKETIEKYMTRFPDALCIHDPISYALNRMASCGYRHIPLVDENQIPIGFLSIRDIVDHIADYFSNEILNLPPSPHAKQRSQEGE